MLASFWYNHYVRILVVHHARTLVDEAAYLTDSYLAANSTLYGAQEMDTWAGVRLLSNNFEVWRVEICLNLQMARLIDHQGREISRVAFSLDKSLRNPHYRNALLKYLDPSIAQFAQVELIQYLTLIASGYEIGAWWVDTQFYDAVIPPNARVIIRSVNFEPVHVLAEDPSNLRVLRSILKSFSERKIAKNRRFITISPLDSNHYSKLGTSIPKVIPLRQLSFLLKETILEILQPNIFSMTGSTYDVRHNRRNLDFILRDLAPLALTRNPTLAIKVYGNRIPSLTDVPSNVILSGFDTNLQAKLIGSLGVIVPYHGGAGMQSKIFEPLALGVPLIANPKSLVGFPYLPSIHYLSAESAQEYLEAMMFISGNKDKADEMANKGKELSKQLFDLDELKQTVKTEVDLLLAK
jgi:hypothetical protein